MEIAGFEIRDERAFCSNNFMAGNRRELVTSMFTTGLLRVANKQNTLLIKLQILASRL